MTRSVLLAPHNDDETLFAAFTCLREKPHVIVVLRSVVQEQRGGPTAAVREAETAAAMEILGCTWEQWDFPDDTRDAASLSYAIRHACISYDHVYAPVPEENGNKSHNMIGQAASGDDEFAGRTTHYLTYTTRGKSEWGRRVEYEPGWVPLKLAALACYRSQAGLANCAEHFVRSQEEYTA